MTNKGFFLGILIFLLASHAVGAERAKVGNQMIEYDEIIEYESMSSYYLGEKLVLSIFDDNGDGKPDQWFVYGPDFVLEFAMGDTDNNGKPDYFVGYDPQGNVVSERVAVPPLKRVADFILKFKFWILGIFVLGMIIIAILLSAKKRKAGKNKHKAHSQQGSKEKKALKALEKKG